MAIVLPPVKATPWKDWLDGLVVGSFLILSIFLKISYGLLLLSAIVGYPLFIRRLPLFYISTLAAAILFIIPFGVMLKWDFGAFLHDMRFLARAHRELGLDGYLSGLVYLWPDVALLLELGSVAAIFEVLASRDFDWRPLLRVAVITFGFAFYAVAILITNTLEGFLRETPVLGIGTMVLLSGVARRLEALSPGGGADRSLRLPQWLAVGFGLLLLAATGAWMRFFEWRLEEAGRNMASLILLLAACISVAWALRERSSRFRAPVLAATCCALAFLVCAPATARNIDGLLIARLVRQDRFALTQSEIFQSAQLKGLQVIGNGEDATVSPDTYVQKIEQGVDLINRTGNANRPVLGLDFTNPFNLAQGIGRPMGPRWIGPLASGSRLPPIPMRTRYFAERRW